jgi:hypothetical protein
METLGNKKLQKSCNDFYCTFCDYTTSRKSSYDKHLLTAKHQKVAFGNVLETKSCKKLQNKNFQCEKCSKEFSNRSGLWKHNKICDTEKFYDELSKINLDKDLIEMLIKQNSKLMEIIENGTVNNSHNTNTNSHNKTAFNLNFFLNETCKNAMNISEFVNSIKPSLEDLEYFGKKGYVEGVSNIILEKLKSMETSYRPIHCSDLKREVLYIKDNDVWEKEDEDKVVLTKTIKTIANENIKNINTWKKQHPGCTESDSKQNNLWLNIVSNSMCGITEEESSKNIEKIISNVAKEVVIKKE